MRVAVVHKNSCDTVKLLLSAVCIKDGICMALIVLRQWKLRGNDNKVKSSLLDQSYSFV